MPCPRAESFALAFKSKRLIVQTRRHLRVVSEEQLQCGDSAVLRDTGMSGDVVAWATGSLGEEVHYVQDRELYVASGSDLATRTRVALHGAPETSLLDTVQVGDLEGGLLCGVLHNCDPDMEVLELFLVPTGEFTLKPTSLQIITEFESAWCPFYRAFFVLDEYEQKLWWIAADGSAQLWFHNKDTNTLLTSFAAHATQELFAVLALDEAEQSVSVVFQLPQTQDAKACSQFALPNCHSALMAWHPRKNWIALINRISDEQFVSYVVTPSESLIEKKWQCHDEPIGLSWSSDGGYLYVLTTEKVIVIRVTLEQA